MEYVFFFFSAICYFPAASGNPRGFGQFLGEKALVILGPTILGAGHFLCCMTLADQQDYATVLTGSGTKMAGVIIVIAATPIMYLTGRKYANLSDEKLSKALTQIFVSLTSVLGSILYVSSGPLRCIMAADTEVPMLQECGNPLFPSLFITFYLWMMWIIIYFVPPIKTNRREKTWEDILMLKFDSNLEGVEFCLFGILTTLTLLMFSNLNEDGEGMTTFMFTLVFALLVVTETLLFVVVFDVLIKPRLCASSPTTQDDDEQERSESTISARIFSTCAAYRDLASPDSKS